MTVIATRLLRLRAEPADLDVAVRLHAPQPDDPAWICRYEIDWPDGVRASFAAGVDAVQAVDLAMRKIGFELYTSPYHASDRLMWEAAGAGYGFPVPTDARDLLVGDDRRFAG